MRRCWRPPGWVVTGQTDWGQRAKGCSPHWSPKGTSLHTLPPSPLLHLFISLPHFTNLPHPDINECEEEDIECGPSQMCFNTRGSYQCVDTPCPATYRQGPDPG